MVYIFTGYFFATSPLTIRIIDHTS